jgi:dTDP-4-amino-4,6-dideoxygalactose transaminase
MDVRFADIDNKTYNISIEGIKKNFTDNTRLIIPVHFAGQPCDMAGIHEIASERGIKIIEDASHAIGGRYSNNKRIGSCCYSDLTTFSFHPVKTMTTGEGGAITTNNPELYHRLILLRSHGITKVPEELSNNTGPWYYEMKMLGFNYRLTDIQAALGISQLNRLDDFVEHRRQLVKKYNDAFEEIPWLTVPFERPEVYSAFHLYVIGIDYRKIGKSRSEVMKLLSDDNIGTQVHYIPVYRLPYYEDLYHFDPEAFANTEKYYASCLSIPLYPSMSEKQQQYVIKKIIALNS